MRCIERARNNAAAQLGAAAVGWVFNPVVGAAASVVAYVLLSNALEACSDAFDACMDKNK